MACSALIELGIQTPARLNIPTKKPAMQPAVPEKRWSRLCVTGHLEDRVDRVGKDLCSANKYSMFSWAILLSNIFYPSSSQITKMS